MKKMYKIKTGFIFITLIAFIAVSLVSTKPAYAAQDYCYIYSEDCPNNGGSYMFCSSEMGGSLHCSDCGKTMRECP